MEILITFGINALSQLLKEKIAPKYGEFGMQVTVFAISLLVAGGYLAYDKIDGFAQFIEYTIGFFTFAITFYEILWKRFKNVKSVKELK